MAEMLPEKGGYLGLSMGFTLFPTQQKNCDQPIYLTQTQSIP